MDNNKRPPYAAVTSQGESEYKTTRQGFKGLERRGITDLSSAANGTVMTDCANMDLSNLAACLMPSPNWGLIRNYGANQVNSLAAFDDFLIVVYRSGTSLYLDYVLTDGSDAVYTGKLKDGTATEADDEIHRSIVQFNVYTTPTDPVGGAYDKKLLIYPDKVSMDFFITENPIAFAQLDVGQNITPDIKYATVFQSRLFGVDDARVYASGFNDYSNFDLDTADEENSANAWMSTAQSDYRADGDFTGLITYDNHVILFKRDFMHMVTNNKNPFRLVDIPYGGAIDNRAMQGVKEKLVYVSTDGIKYFTGGFPHKMSLELNIDEYTDGVTGVYKDTFYVYQQEDGINKAFTWNADFEQWSCEILPGECVGMGNNNNGFYALCTDGLYRRSKDYGYGSWWFESDVSMVGTTELKHIKKFTVYADLDDSAGFDVYLLKGAEAFNADTSMKILSANDSTKHVFPTFENVTEAWGHKLHFEGNGMVKLQAVEIRYAYGGDNLANL
jgi:hypothetical protein